MNLLYAIFESFWRRAFGSGNFNRVILHIINVLATSFVLRYNDISWWRVVVVACVFELLWATSHSEFFDFGHKQPPDVSKYEQFWWWKWVKKIIPESAWYGFACDFVCMSIRYTLPALIIALFLPSILFCFVGVLVACGYALMWKLYDWWGIKEPTKYAEYIAGFIAGLFLVM